jgi:hypothetical protein
VVDSSKSDQTNVVTGQKRDERNERQERSCLAEGAVEEEEGWIFVQMRGKEQYRIVKKRNDCGLGKYKQDIERKREHFRTRIGPPLKSSIIPVHVTINTQNTIHGFRVVLPRIPTMLCLLYWLS